MPLFVCDKCSGIENTGDGDARYKSTGAHSGFLVKNHDAIEALCSECKPVERGGGKWHGHFLKVIATEEMVRELGNWLERQDREGVPRGFIHYGKFEYLRLELEQRMRNAHRRAKYKARKKKGSP
jgi:hypothetical protein